MRRSQQPEIPPETKLGLLAMQFRSTKDKSKRQKIMSEYENIVNQLIKNKAWDEMPGFEDMLPDEYMPERFFQYWKIPCPDNPNARR
jgi:hypothetical protein